MDLLKVAHAADQALGEALGRLIDARVRAALASATGDPLDRIPHSRWGFRSPRLACEAARTGAIRATKVGRSYHATRAELDRYFAEHAAPTAANDVEPVDLVLASVRAAARRAK